MTIWTTSQYLYDQRIQRIHQVMVDAGMQVKIFDRATSQYPEGELKSTFSKGPAMYFDYNRRIASQVKKQKADLIYAADIDVMPGLIWGLQGSSNRRLLLDLHEWFPEVIELEGKPMKKAIWKWVERKSVAFANSVVTINQAYANIFQSKYHRPVDVIRNVPWLKPAPEVDVGNRLKDKILYYQGAINHGRGLPEIIKSLHLLPGWKLWLVGDGDILDELKLLSRRENLDNRVEFKGRRLPEELVRFASAATVGLNLLDHKSGSYYYSLANKYFDYMHALLPSIHMNFPEYQNLMDEIQTGALVTGLNPGDIARAIKQMTVNEDHYRYMIDSCLRGRQTYNWQQESLKLRAILSSSLGH